MCCLIQFTPNLFTSCYSPRLLLDSKKLFKFFAFFDPICLLKESLKNGKRNKSGEIAKKSLCYFVDLKK